MKKFIFASVILGLVLVMTGSVLAYVSASSNYRLEKDSLNLGGLDVSASPSFNVKSTLGEITSGLLAGSNYNASTGYRYMEAETGTAPVVVTVRGCTDPKANNYNSSATQDDGSCTYTTVSGGIRGCIDYRANNFNPNATVDDGSCTYTTIPTVWGCTDPVATNYNPLANRNNGSCSYPPNVDGSVYGCLDSRARNFNPLATRDNGSCEYSPFTAPNEQVFTTLSDDWNFRFIQPNERVKTFDPKMRVWILGEKDLTILFNYKLVPKTLKTIGITLTDPDDKTKTFSFLMHRSADGSAYEATIGPLVRRGTYPIDIFIIDYANQTVERIKGRLIVSGLDLAIAETVTVAVATFSFLPYLYNLLTTLLRVFAYFFGRRKKGDSWGTVFDSVTKQPLDPAYVIAEDLDPATGNRREISTAITDIDGRFSFFLPAGTYYLKANKTHYRFPSTRLAGRERDELYDHLYFGEAIDTTGNEVINLNIPMDPIDFDWNEFAKTKTDFFRFYNRRKLWLNRLWRLIFLGGFIFSLYALVISPSLWNGVMAGLYVALFIFNRYWRDSHKPLTIYSERTGEPLPFAIIRLFLPELNQQIKYAVADKFGRFYLLVRPGVYYFTVEEKLPDGSYQKLMQSNPMSLPKGILTNDIYVK